MGRAAPPADVSSAGLPPSMGRRQAVAAPWWGRVAPPHAAACTPTCRATSPRAPTAGGTAAPATVGTAAPATVTACKCQPPPRLGPRPPQPQPPRLSVAYRTPRPVPTARVRPPAAGKPARVGAPRRCGTPNRQPPRAKWEGRRGRRGARVEREATIHAGRGTRPAAVASEGSAPHTGGVRWQLDSGQRTTIPGRRPDTGARGGGRRQLALQKAQKREQRGRP